MVSFLELLFVQGLLPFVLNGLLFIRGCCRSGRRRGGGDRVEGRFQPPLCQVPSLFGLSTGSSHMINQLACSITFVFEIHKETL